jgi:uncharacterized membrane protein
MKRITRLLRIAMFLLVIIGVAMVIRRILAMAGIGGSFNPPAGSRFGGGTSGASFDAEFARHSSLILLHIIPGALFLLLGPWQFMSRIRNKYPRFHRRSGLLVIGCGYIIGLSALVLPFVLRPVGGLNEAAATTFFALYFLFALTMAWRKVRQKDFAAHRRWMIRMFSTGLAVATIRPIVALFFAFSGQPPQVFFGTAFWIGFTLHLILAEAWINYTRDRLPNNKFADNETHA